MVRASYGPLGAGLLLFSFLSFGMTSTVSAGQLASCRSGIVTSPSPGTVGNHLSGVVSLSAANAWVVGTASSPVGTPPMLVNTPLVAHWDGRSWGSVTTPALPSGGSFSSIAAVSATNIWAVGHQGPSDGGTPLVEHWTGSSWSSVASPVVNLGYLLGVSADAADDVWAVGIRLGQVSHSLFEHWNGAAWTVVRGPNPGVDYTEVDGVVAMSRANAWAVGFSVTSNVSTPLVAHWNGSSWATVSTPATGAANSVLRGVAAASAHDAWAVGQASSADGSTIQTLVEHWNGTAWSVVASPSPTSQSWLRSVGVDDGKIWAVGVRVDGFTNHNLVERGTGGSFTVVASPNRGTGNNGLEAVAPTDGFVWAVGGDQGRTRGESLVIRICA